MYATPAMIAWASDNDCPPPQSLSRRMAFDVFDAICELDPDSRAPWVGALFQWMKHRINCVSDFANEIVSGIDVASLAPNADTISYELPYANCQMQFHICHVTRLVLNVAART